MKVLASFFGADEARDNETFFLALAVEFGHPKPLQELRARHGKKGPVVTIPGFEPDIAFITRFAELAHQLHVSCQNEEDFRRLYNAYIEWYERNHPADVQR